MSIPSYADGCPALITQKDDHDEIAIWCCNEMHDELDHEGNCGRYPCPRKRDQLPPTINGYPVADLEFAAKLMNSAGLTPDDLRKCINNIEYVVNLVYSDLHNAMDKTAAEFAARMLNHSAPEFTVPQHYTKLGTEEK